MPKPPLPAPKAVKPPVPNRPKFLAPWETGVPAPVAVMPDTAEPGIAAFERVEPYDFSHIHPKTQAIRRLFVAEYVKDFNGAGALARLGFNFSQPSVVSNRWLKEPFTQFLLDRYITEAEEEALVTRNRIISALTREANSYGLDSSGASRVSALGKLARILGMEIDRSEVDVRVAGGIMLVPMAATSDEWERNAAKAQLELKAEAVA